MADSKHTTRLAPSPTGALHLGNVRTFVLNSLLARRGGWRVVMRVEDLDSPRVKEGAAGEMLEDLRWLGLEWEGESVYQSRRAGAYEAALRTLAEMGAVYPCTCSRKDVQAAASAPHAEQGVYVYPGTCRPPTNVEQASRLFGRQRTGAISGAMPLPVCGEGHETVGHALPQTARKGMAPTVNRIAQDAAWRVLVDETPIVVKDEFAGQRSFDLSRTCGDFVVWTRQGQAAYQLAVVVDDEEAGVDAIVRGDDLLESAARQIHLRRLLGIERAVRTWHLPLVIGPDGRRLAKRHGDTRLTHYRRAGASVEKVLGLIGFWSGLLPRRQEADLAELERWFDMERVPRGPVVFSQEDERFLMGR